MRMGFSLGGRLGALVMGLRELVALKLKRNVSTDMLFRRFDITAPRLGGFKWL